jgi:hypothetical protein
MRTPTTATAAWFESDDSRLYERVARVAGTIMTTVGSTKHVGFNLHSKHDSEGILQAKWTWGQQTQCGAPATRPLKQQQQQQQQQPPPVSQAVT